MNLGKARKGKVKQRLKFSCYILHVQRSLYVQLYMYSVYLKYISLNCIRTTGIAIFYLDIVDLSDNMLKRGIRFTL